MYWALGGQDRWPAGLETRYNSETPLEVARQQFDNIAVIDFFPATIYSPRTKFWPVIDDALRAAAVERGVRVDLVYGIQLKHKIK